MHKEILDALKSKFADVGESILDRIARKGAKTVTRAEDVAPYVEGITIQQVIDGEADRRATEAQKTAVENYERKHGLRDGRPVKRDDADDDTPQPHLDTPTDAVPSWARAQAETMKALMSRLDAMESRRTTDDRRAKLDAAVSGLPEALRKPFARTAVEGLTDEAFDTLLEEVKADVADISKSTRQRSAAFGRPPGASDPDAAADLSESQKTSIEGRDKGSDAQPF